MKSGIVMTVLSGFCLVLVGCEGEWKETEMSKNTEYSEEYGKQYMAHQQYGYSTVCLGGVEYWNQSRKLAVKFGTDSKVVKCDLKNLEGFKKYRMDREEVIKWDSKQRQLMEH